ncbi:hypothetical protein Esi_0009_0188 [Ectocarpus siliculosus]|uniref:Uncharacterized protein n=1 Tax=Ectocarpus siliculosus TaxID=2880 RepID=D8LTU9_ECTSI|nr:hypothetical protein Esi_0009_0188 [Ectocarpus siliculosus]|eukprot:CBN73996.1 hypothetical protein Esi_0009_0188 [Ectocarpus siliculosus]
MEILEIDADSGLVVGLNGTEAFLWRLPPLHQTSGDVPMRGSVGEVEVPTLPNTSLGGDANGGFEGRRYQYLGSMPDLHSSEVTAIGVREPLLATGLANGRIFLWRINASSSCSLKRIVLAVFDAHDAFPILTLRLLRSCGASDQGVTSPSSPAAPGVDELKSSKGVDASSGVINNGRGGSSEDWSIISGGGDGTVAHLSVVGLASAREAASGVAEAGVELRMIGDYEASRKTRSAHYTSVSATSGDRVGNGRFAANRRPGVSHIMAIRLSAGEEAGVFGSGVDTRRAAADTTGRGTSLCTGKGGENFQAPAKGSSWAEVIASARGKSGGGGSGRDFCVAVSGGLISVLEVVEPLQHVGWVGRETTADLTAGVYGGGGKKREVARMMRVPSVWRSAREEDIDCAADDFMVMCDDGWFGWYHGYHGRFELVSRLTLTAPGGSHFAEATAAGSDTTCFAVCPIPAVGRNTSANDSVVSCKYAFNAGAPESARIVVGYSDGSIACASLPAPSSSTNHPLPTFGTGSRHHERERGERTVRRLRRAGGGGGGGDGGGGAAIEAAITALCPLSAPLVVAGDSDGRLALWTTSSALPPDGSPLLWEDRNAHRGVVIAIERVKESTPSTPASGLSCNGSTHAAHRTSRPREWVVSVGSGGEIRVWNVPSRWPGGAAVGRGRDTGGGLEFRATLLTNSSICSFSCALLLPLGDACIGDGGGINGCGGNGGFGQVQCEDHEREKSQEQGEKRRCRSGARPGAGQAEATGGRLYCVAGSDNGFVQAWELSLDGEEGVGGQPLWSQKTHDAAVTKMDMWELYPSDPDGPKARKTTGLNISSSTTTSVPEIHAKGPREALVVHHKKEKENNAGLESNEAPPPSPPHCQAVGKGGRRGAAKLVENSVTECLVLSAALDRTLCVFRARHGRALHLLRRLNVPCSPRGLPGALFVGIPVERASEGVTGTQLKSKAGAASSATGGPGGASGADSHGERGTKRVRPEARDSGIRGQPGPQRQRPGVGMLKNKKLKNGGGRCGGGDDNGDGFVATQQAVNSLGASSTGTTKDGFAGNAGRWQQRLGITVEGESSGPGENGGDEGAPPHEATTARELMEDTALREAFAARGRHKKSPVLAREVKATLKAWSPGVMEACSRADFSAAMGDLTSRETVSFQRVCEIAAAVLEATGGVATRRAAGQEIGCTSVAASSTIASRQGNNARRRDHHPLLSAKQCDSGSRPARYRNMAKFKTRLQYNSMGERVVVRVAVDDIDAFAARSRQGPHLAQDQRKQQHRQGFDGGAGGWDPQAAQPDVCGSEDKVIARSCPTLILTLRQVVDHMYSEDDLDSLARPSRATAANLGCVPAGLRGVWSRQGSCMFSSWSASHHAERPADQLPAEGTDGTAEVMGEGECVRLVREVLDGRAAAREAALMACRRLGRCAPDSHAIVVDDGIYSENSRGEKCDASACFDLEEDTSCCPASRVETLGVALYRDFRRRYGLQRTAEERVAGLLGAVLEHGPASPVLRLFARMVGAPAGASGEGRWPSQTPSEDANLGLEPQLVNLVTAARHWLITRGFMTTDGPWAGVGENGKTMRDSGFGIGWRTTIVARTHAAMCASALLTPGWGAGHQIMGAAEQKLASTTNDGLFGRRAMAGHSFLLAKARDINAGASAAATEHEQDAAQVGRKTTTERSLESLLDTVSKSPPSLLAAPASGEYYRTRIASSGDNSGRGIKGVGSGDFRGNQAGDAHAEGEPVVPNQNNDDDDEDHSSNNNSSSSKNFPASNNNPPDTEEQDGGGAKGTRFRNRENELGEGGKVLQRLKPLLDNFILEDTQRTGTLPAADFRRVLCEGHGGLWPGLGTSVRSDIGFVLIPEESAAEFIDPRLTSPENDAARALVRRFMDVFDGQACYLDVWITLYHAVFRTGKIVPFTELPSICEMQLRGADTEHWQALLEYLETAGIGDASPKHCISERSSGGGGEREDWPVGVRALSSKGQPSGSTLDHSGRDAFKQEGGGCASSHVSTMARGSSTPVLGLLRTAINGGAASSHTVTAGTSARRPRPSTATKTAPATAKPVKGPVEWPRAGWGPGSLTVSRPPRAAGPSGTTLPTAAVTLALNPLGIHGGEGVGVCGAAEVLGELGLESEGVRVGGGGVVADGPACVGGGGILEEGNPTRSPHHSRAQIQLQFSSQPLAGEGSWDGGGGADGRGGGREGRQEAENDISVIRDEDVPGDEGNGGDHSRKNNRGVDWSEDAPHSGYDQDRYPSQQAHPSRFDEDSMSGGVLLYNLDCGTLEPPSPQPPSPEQQGGGRDNVGTERGQQSTGVGRRKKRREKRTMTSLYVRCPFLDPVKSKHAYRVPRGRRLNAPPPMPIFREAVDSASMAAQLYSSIASVKAKKAAADSAVHAERQQDLGSRGRKDKNRNRHRDAGGGTGGPLELHFPQSLKEATLREGSSQSRERRHDTAGRYTPGPGGGGGRGGEEAHMAAAEDRESWTGQRQRRKSTDVGAASSEPPAAGDIEAALLASAVDDNLSIEGRRGFVLAGTATGKRVVSPKASRSPPHTRGGGVGRRLQSPGFTPPRSRESPTRPLTAASAEPGNTSPATKEATASGTVNEQDPSDSKAPNVDGEPPAGKAPPPRAAGQTRRARGRGRRGSAGRRGRERGRGRRGPETTGDSDDDSDDDGQGGSGVDAKKASQQRMIEAMMAEQAAKRRASGDAMKRLIAEEEERKRLRKAEEDAERIAQEKAKQELEERQRRELEERRKALAKKRADLEEKNRRLEEERLKKEAERQAADQARREANEVRRQQEAARKAEEERVAREEDARLAKEEEEKLKREEDERLAEAEEALKRAAVERERAREAGEQQRMTQHDEDIDIVLRANVAIAQEEAKLEREAEAVREAEELERVAQDAKRKHACLLMSKADEESALWNERWQMEDAVVKVELQEVKKKKKRARSRVVRDEHGNPVDIRLWEMECTAQTDFAGRLVQQECYVDGSGGYTFDPRDVFQGEGGGIGGRGGGRGDGTTLPDAAGTSAEGGTEGQEEGTSDGEDETCLDAEGLLERERRWMEGIFAASRPDDLSCLFQDSTGSGKNNPDAFFPMVLSERVAWPEYMNMVKAALVAQADAIIKQGVALEASSGTRGGNGACDVNGGGSDEGRTRAVTSSSENITAVLNPSQRLQTPGNAPEFVAQGGHGSGGGSDIVRGEQQQRSTARKAENTRDPSGVVAAAGAAESINGAYPPPMAPPSHRYEQRAAAGTGAEMKIRPVKLGRTVRGTTGVGPESRAFFRFDLPSTGVIVTVVLEVADGDPEIMVTRGVLPSLGQDEAARDGSDVSGWKSSSTQRDLHVVKIFPRDTNYGPGEYFVGIVSRGNPSRFRLRVSAASPADEISTHMRTATAIVDNLAVMSNMDPHRLVKDFVGARLEAEETLRKQRAAALLDRVVDSPEVALDASHRNSLQLDETISGRQPQDQGLLEQHQRPDSSSGSEQHSLRPGPAEDSSPASDARHHVVSSAVTPSPSAGDETPRSGASARDLCNEGALQTDGEQRLLGAAPVALTALRQRERALASPVAVLDDRMARARPTGLLATVRPASVSVSTLVSHSAPVPAVGLTCFDRSSDEDVVDDAAGRVVAFGAELRGNAAVASNEAAVAATHGRYLYGQRRRRMSVPLLASLAGGDEDAGALGSGARAREMRRPWTTPNSEGEAEVIMREEREEDSSRGGVTVRPFRHSRTSGVADVYVVIGVRSGIEIGAGGSAGGA